MRISISTVENHTETFGKFPPDLLRFRMDQENPFYQNDDYIYEFQVSGEHRTFPRPLGFRPSEQELNRQGRLQLKALFRPKIELPPKEIKELIAGIIQTGLIDPQGARGGIVWPITLTSKWELHVIKLPHASVKDVETAMLHSIATHFNVSVDQLETEYGR